MADCLFCKIVEGKIPSTKVFEDEFILIFKDIKPMAPTHLVAIPKEHFPSIHDVPPQKSDVLKRLMEAVAKTVVTQNLTASGYRIVINSGEHAGQTVPHIHAHILAGRDLSWPPG
jgi:histidine triad (HIT) family protein